MDLFKVVLEHASPGFKEFFPVSQDHVFHPKYKGRSGAIQATVLVLRTKFQFQNYHSKVEVKDPSCVSHSFGKLYLCLNKQSETFQKALKR